MKKDLNAMTKAELLAYIAEQTAKLDAAETRATEAEAVADEFIYKDETDAFDAAIRPMYDFNAGIELHIAGLDTLPTPDSFDVKLSVADLQALPAACTLADAITTFTLRARLQSAEQIFAAEYSRTKAHAKLTPTGRKVTRVIVSSVSSEDTARVAEHLRDTGWHETKTGFRKAGEIIDFTKTGFKCYLKTEFTGSKQTKAGLYTASVNADTVLALTAVK